MNLGSIGSSYLEMAHDTASAIAISKEIGEKISKIIDELQEHASLGTAQQFFEGEKGA